MFLKKCPPSDLEIFAAQLDFLTTQAILVVKVGTRRDLDDDITLHLVRKLVLR